MDASKYSEPTELDKEDTEVCALLDEINKDPEAKNVTWDKSNSLICIDFGTVEYAVLMKYCMDDAGTLHIKEITYGSEILEVDVTATKGIIIDQRDILSFEKAYGNPRRVRTNHPYKMVDGQHDRNGNYRFDYGRNDHPRSPRKRR